MAYAVAVPPVTGQTITQAQLLRLYDEVLEEMAWQTVGNAEYRRLAAILGHVTTALGWRKPPRGGSEAASADLAAAAWNARHP